MKLLLFALLLVNTFDSLYASYAKCMHNDTGKFILETNSGKIRGNCQYLTSHAGAHSRGGNVYSWLGIPFAEPPVGENRFKAPQPVKPWNHVLDATKWPNSCVQNVDETLSNLKPEDQFSAYKMWIPSRKYTNFSEDCLYLNLWVPAEAYLKKGLTHKVDLRPIIVFIHGTSGTPVLDIFDPSIFVVTTDIIAVTITYRTGILGNFYLEGEAQGNQGILDQHMALKWIHSNAEKFGGDPNKITLYGSSAGAAAIGAHLVYRPSWPLFRSAILSAGSPFAGFFRPISATEASNRSRGFLQAITCGNGTSPNSELFECAKRHDPHYLAKHSQDYFVKFLLTGNTAAASNMMTGFPPVIDGTVITEPFEESFKKNNFKSCPILAGTAMNEGSMFIAYAGLMGTKSSELRRQVAISYNKLVEFVEDFFKYYPSYPKASTKAFIDLVLFQYTKLTSGFNDQESALMKLNYFGALSRIIGDYSFVCPTNKLIDIYARRNHSVYTYLYSHRISTSPWPSWYGTVHADELAMVFGQPLSNRPHSSAISTNPWLSPKNGYPESEEALSREMIQYWENFINNGDPNVNSENSNPEGFKDWPTYKLTNSNLSDNKQYVVFRANGSRVARNYAFEECQFWNHLVPTLLDELEKTSEMLKAPAPIIVCTTPAPVPTPAIQKKDEMKDMKSADVSAAIAVTSATTYYRLLSLVIIFTLKFIF